jgi:hypothetical protein
VDETGYGRYSYFLEDCQESDHPSGNEEPAQGEMALFSRAKRDSQRTVEDEELELSDNSSPLGQRKSFVEEQRTEHPVKCPKKSIREQQPIKRAPFRYRRAPGNNEERDADGPN